MNVKDFSDYLADLVFKGEGFSLKPAVLPRSGASYLPSPTDGYMVSLANHGMSLGVLDRVNVERVRVRVRAWLDEYFSFVRQHGELYFGGWMDEEHGEYYLDVSERIVDLAVAVDVADEREQLAIWDVKKGREIRLGASATV